MDPTTGTYVIKASQVPQIYTLVPRAEADKFLQDKRSVELTGAIDCQA